MVPTNGQAVATGEHYETHRAWWEVIESARKNVRQEELDDPTAKKD
ncbi:DUF1508 domain-containing protein [Terrabacter sp. 2YAF2]